MVYIEIDIDNKVITQHFFPFDEDLGFGKTEEELLKTGFLVNSIPEMQTIPGKEAILKYNKESDSFYFEYGDIPISEESEIEILKKQVAELSFLVMQLQGGTN